MNYQYEPILYRNLYSDIGTWGLSESTMDIVNEAASKNFDTNVIIKKLYPMVDKALSGPSGPKFKKNIGEFINNRHSELYDNAPYTRIYFTKEDADKLFTLMGISSKTIEEILKETYYNTIEPFNPRCAKDPFTILTLMCVRYYMIKNNSKDLELSLIYLAFSGSFYPSIHYGSFPVAQPSEYRHIMEYVVNNELSQKYDLKREGHVIGAIRSVNNTWVTSYASKLKSSSCTDEDVVYVLQQLHNRVKSFMVNIATMYYQVYNSKDLYLTFNSDSVEEDSFRMADNDSLKAERCVQSAMNYITTSTVNYKFCKMSADNYVRVDEINSIITSIQSEPENIKLINELISILITEYFASSPIKDVTDIGFFKFAIKAKPNSKNPKIIRLKEIIETLLSENSSAYLRRRSKDATRNSYHSCILKYYSFVINDSNK